MSELTKRKNEKSSKVIYCMLILQGFLCIRDGGCERDAIRLDIDWGCFAKVFSYRIFSSCVPRVMRTSADIKSLKLIPLLVPPQAWNSQSAIFEGVPSHNTSCTKAFLFSKLPFAPADRLNASFMRRHSASDTKMTQAENCTLIKAYV